MKLQNESLASIKRQIRNYSSDSDRHKVKGAVCVKITTARELPPAEYKEFVANLTNKLGREILVERVVDPALVGGIVIQYGDNVFDGSVARQFKEYKEMMSKIDVEKIGVTDAV